MIITRLSCIALAASICSFGLSHAASAEQLIYLGKDTDGSPALLRQDKVKKSDFAILSPYDSGVAATQARADCKAGTIFVKTIYLFDEAGNPIGKEVVSKLQTPIPNTVADNALKTVCKNIHPNIGK